MSDETTEGQQGPTNGQRALDNSVGIPAEEPRRIGIDPVVGEIVVFTINERSRYAGTVRSWQQLSKEEQDALIDNDLINEQGAIILRDIRGNILGRGKSVIDPTTALESWSQTEEEVGRALASRYLQTWEEELLSLALYDPDWQRTEVLCLRMLDSPEVAMRSQAAECISHLIYNQHHLNFNRVRKALLQHQDDERVEVRRSVLYAIEDVSRFASASTK